MPHPFFLQKQLQIPLAFTSNLCYSNIIRRGGYNPPGQLARGRAVDKFLKAREAERGELVTTYSP